MNTKQKIMALAALPLAGLLASGGVAAAQTAGAPSGTQVVQQAATRQAGDPGCGHVVVGATRQCPSATAQRDQDRGCGTCRSDGVSQPQAAQGASTAARIGHDGSCADHGGR